MLKEGDTFIFVDPQTNKKSKCVVLFVLPKGEDSYVMFTDNSVVDGEYQIYVGEYNHKKKKLRATDENENTKNILFALLKKMEEK